jgi:hypothetical protein
LFHRNESINRRMNLVHRIYGLTAGQANVKGGEMPVMD